MIRTTGGVLSAIETTGALSQRKAGRSYDDITCAPFYRRWVVHDLYMRDETVDARISLRRFSFCVRAPIADGAVERYRVPSGLYPRRFEFELSPTRRFRWMAR